MPLFGVGVRICCGPCRAEMGLVPQVAQAALRAAEWAQENNLVVMAEPHQRQTPAVVAERQATLAPVGAAAMVRVAESRGCQARVVVAAAVLQGGVDTTAPVVAVVSVCTASAAMVQRG